MKKANKALAALLALTMVTGSLAGCGSSNGSGKTETRKAQQRQQMLVHLQAARILW